MWTKRTKIALVFVCLSVCSVFLSNSSAQSQKSPPQKPVQTTPKTIDYERFTHQSHTGTVNVPSTNHAKVLKCDSCHERRDGQEKMKELVANTDRNKKLSLKFPGHKACVDCHVTQFTARPQQTCTICHETKQGLTARPPQRDFQKRYDFNALFDANQHELHATYDLPNSTKKLDCNFCHKQEARPAVMTVPSHPECYVCHSPGSGSQKGSQKSGCVDCHTAMTPDAKPFSDKYVSLAYGALFTHKSHVAYLGQRCEMCHTTSGLGARPTPTAIKINVHAKRGRSCFDCHDGGVHYGRKVFCGEPGCEGGGSCFKCHTRPDNKVFPSSGVRG